MAKQKMRCVFSEQLCRSCSLFRGRHYYLCFSRTYRGYLGAESVCRESSRGYHLRLTGPEIQSRGVVLVEKRDQTLALSGTPNRVERNGPQQG